MRIPFLAFGLGLSMSLIACGSSSDGDDGDDDAGADARPQPDARETVDAGPFACQFPASTTNPIALNPGEFDGSMTDDGAYAFGIFITFTVDPGEPTQTFLLQYVDNAGVFAPGGELGSLTGPPGTGIVANINTGEDGSEIGAGFLGATGYTEANGLPDLETAQQIYLVDEANPGTITLAEFDNAAGPGVVSHFTGTYEAVNLVGYDPVSGEPNTCVFLVGELSFDWSITWPAGVAKAAVVPEQFRSPGLGLDMRKFPHVTAQLP